MKTFDQFWAEFGAGIAWNPDNQDAARRVWLAARAGLNTDNEAAFDQLLHNPRELAQQDADAFGIGYVVDGQRVAPHRVQVFVPAASQQATEPVARRLNDAEVRQVFLRHGFTIKEGQADLKPYVFDAAHALMDAMLSDPAPCSHAWDCDQLGFKYSIWRCIKCGAERKR